MLAGRLTSTDVADVAPDESTEAAERSRITVCGALLVVEERVSTVVVERRVAS